MVNKRKTGGLLMEFYTYVWRDSAGVPFYIGKGKGKRAYATYNRQPEFKAIYAQGGCTVEIVDYFIHESQAHAHEVELIAQFGRRDVGTGILVNKTDGGEGLSGWTPSAETLAKRSALMRGKKRSAESRANMSAAKRGKPGPRHTAETRAKISAAHMGKKMPPRSDDHRAKISERLTGRPVSAETRAKIGARSIGNTYGLGRVKSLEEIERTASANRGQKRSPESRAKMSAAQRGRKTSDETRARLSEATKGVPHTLEHTANSAAAKRLSPPKSGFKGVREIRDGKWVARFALNGTRKHLGVFDSAIDAAKAYDRAAFDALGLGCFLNFPNDIGDKIAA
ncbi:hypothetical protein EN868_03120 [Mesorhizobium sp. M2D.F.Ca.ET.225.01.1.1]|uniref:NUMOD3 domain-containing DNA-binding protein n=1 Tax=unclassified Mesorhizobium TaxID=325217 RepID=UPI000FD4408D|nr:MULTISPECIES: NUMOD3 domain-containing DNA-binding protein [unclassified Mesorhizobium]TGP65455.1 hypothetical protein EN869_003125 [Mesorhizobium sp. M2D.F.Ca.ET.226.01.1.1]TGP71934.1 hypothetical protein EN868_03120 [Mesorhizobium sp. M2D.F.Ca.ET.225.01.1.1]